MHDLASAVFVLRPQKPFMKRQFMGHAAQKLFFEMVSALDAPGESRYALWASRLYAQQTALPVTVSDLFQIDAGHYWVRITVLDADHAGLLAQMVQQLPQQATVDGWQVDFGALSQHEWARQTSYADFVAAHWKVPAQPVTLEFVTPTLLKSIGIDRLYPEPALVFKLLYERLLKLPGIVLPFQPDVDVVELFAGAMVSVESYTLACETLLLKTRLKAFRGQASYRIEKQNEAFLKRAQRRSEKAEQDRLVALYEDFIQSRDMYARLMNLLAQFAFYSGLGRYTVQGMGMVRLTSSR